jgi:hypothetical protein
MQFPGFVRTIEPVLGMIYMRGEKSALPFKPGSSFREDEAPAESRG